ncbi:hypothetical protein [Bernardetia sp.]|uniref:hypothetical protein n=1 Tax=Bernardetia sp. TaxID=1937974 RepID=UPI0025C62A15|nr:hypothetical protein [Bernardetia sp.]
MSLPQHLPTSENELLYDVDVSTENALRIYYNEEAHCIITRSIGFVYEDELRTFLNKIISFLEEKNTNKLIVDLTYRQTYTEEDQDWIDKDWFPRALKAGLTYFGYVLPTDLFMQLSADEILVKQKGSVHVIPFGTLEKAIEWIKQQGE